MLAGPGLVLMMLMDRDRPPQCGSGGRGGLFWEWGRGGVRVSASRHRAGMVWNVVWRCGVAIQMPKCRDGIFGTAGGERFLPRGPHLCASCSIAAIGVMNVEKRRYIITSNTARFNVHGRLQCEVYDPRPNEQIPRLTDREGHDEPYDPSPLSACMSICNTLQPLSAKFAVSYRNQPAVLHYFICTGNGNVNIN